MLSRRVLIVTNRVPYPLNDGGAIAMDAMLKGYKKAGWDIFLLSMNTSRHYIPVDALSSFYRKIQFETFDIQTDVRLVPTIRNFFLSKKPNHAERFYNKEFGDRLKAIVARFDPHLIQLESLYLATYLPFLREVTSAKIALRLHNIEYQIWERLAEESSSLRKYYLKDLYTRIKIFELNAWRHADILIPICEEDAAVVQPLMPSKKCLLLPFGIDTEKNAAVGVKEQWVGYHIGAMDWMPNSEAMHWFLEAIWKDLHAAIPEFRFYFAGRNMPGSFEKYEGSGVVCAGEVPDAREFIADKKILIVPLRSGGGIRVKILEAMAAGKLVISTSIGVQGLNGVQSGKHLLVADSKEDFIRQIQWATSHTQEAGNIAEEGRRYVHEHYDRNRFMTQFLIGLEACLES